MQILLVNIGLQSWHASQGTSFFFIYSIFKLHFS